ncbi:MAG: DUF6379 domain-containing protein [Clostridiales bacterium]|nr:DUF6379 domain-containing protein [Clostridiales bacterium]
MFDNNVYIDNTLKNVVENDQTVGYEMQTNITYYRGIPMSMIVKVEVKEDGQDVPRDDIRISVDYDDWFTLEEARTAVNHKWEYGEPLYVRVLKDGGLAAGTHEMVLTEAIRTAYIPTPLEGVKAFTVTI